MAIIYISAYWTQPISVWTCCLLAILTPSLWFSISCQACTAWRCCGDGVAWQNSICGHPSVVVVCRAVIINRGFNNYQPARSTSGARQQSDTSRGTSRLVTKWVIVLFASRRTDVIDNRPTAATADAASPHQAKYIGVVYSSKAWNHVWNEIELF